LKISFSALAQDLVSLVYPEVCMACGRALMRSEQVICTHCRFHLPRTGYHLQPDNPVMKMFWGRVGIQAAASCFLFTKGSGVQKLVHQLKYSGQTEVGRVLGRLYGSELKLSPLFAGIDVIAPVPLHPDKLKKRGYNQCDFFAEGLSESLGVPADLNNVQRVIATGSQTRRSRFERWKNVEYVFSAQQPLKLEGKHILLVDDVVTTGSTLEACAQQLLKIPGARVSIATIACAAD
jgi:ComF family protein